MAKSYGRWRTVGSIGEGGQAHLFLVEDTKGEHPGRYVLKRLINPGRLDLFEREVRAMQTVQHPNVLRLIDYDLHGGPAYYVAEYCEGGNLQDQLDRFRGDVRAAVEVLLPVVDALHAAHAADVVHRDVKPPNILFRADGTPVLGDFGICHREGDKRVTLTAEAMGSKDYIAPEMETGRKGPVTGAVDIYAVGKLLYAMVSGGGMFSREDHRAEHLYLPNILGHYRWEHVHALLDSMVSDDIARRNPIALIPTLLRKVEHLVMGDFMPLKRSMALPCRWCGLGTYQEWTRLRDWLGGHDVKALRCDHCGHVEVFNLQAGVADHQWWNR